MSGSASTIGSVRTVVVGGYTAEMGGAARGVTSLRIDLARPDGLPAVVDEVPLTSPSYLVRHPSEPWIYAVSEATPSAVSAVRIGPNGRLTLSTQVDTGGEAACHLALSPDRQYLLVAHYGSGSVASVALRPDGDLAARADLLALDGSGPDPERQDGPHAHQVLVDGDELLVPDLGADRVHRLRLGDGGRLALVGAVTLPPGTGPRHGVVHGDFLLVAGELSATVWVGRRTAGGWSASQELPASTSPGSARVAPSALVADGTTVFLANRGPGTVAVFDLEVEHGRLRPVAEFPAGGRQPRDLTLTADHLWVANQAEDLVTVFDRRTLPPVLPALGFDSPAPACVLVLADVDGPADAPAQPVA